MADSLRAFFADVESPDRHLVVINRESPDPVRNLLDSMLTDQAVSITDIETAADERDVVALVEDGKVLARSTLDELLESVLLINSDLYKTGAIELDEVVLPDVLKGLDEVPFRLRGYPASNKEKLLLIVVSRVIERIAAETGGGTLRSSFQRLSRLRDERGTFEVYKTIGDSPVDVHVYGVGALETDESVPVTVHSGTSYPYRRSWFVVFTPPEDRPSADHAALLALEVEKNVWEAFWTFRPELVRTLDSYIETEL